MTEFWNGKLCAQLIWGHKEGIQCRRAHSRHLLIFVTNIGKHVVVQL